MELGNITAELILKNIPYVLFLGFLAIVYIANAHYSEKKVRQIQSLEREVKELRWHYMSMKSQLMYNTKQSRVMEEVDEIGLKPMANKIKKIKVPKD